MALISCPECGGMVSDKAKACPHCGCPIEKKVQTYKIIITSLKTSLETSGADDIAKVLRRTFKMVNDCEIYKRLINMEIHITNKCILFDGISYENAEYALDKLPKDTCKADIKESETPINKEINDHLTDLRVARCPRCGSREIDVGNRGDSVLWGPKSMNVCYKCQYRWEP